MSVRTALSLWQPYASLCATPHPDDPGRPLKPVENRSWAPPPGLIGQRLWIHASKKLDHEGCLGLRYQDESDEIAAAVAVVEPMQDLPLGVLLGSVLVRGWIHDEGYTVPGESEWGPFGRWRWHGIERGEAARLFRSPWYAGPGSYGWVLADPQPLAVPVPMRGRQGLWRFDEAVLGRAA